MKTIKTCGAFFLVTFFATNLFAADVAVKTAPNLTVQEPVVVAPTVVAPTVAPTVVEPRVIAPVVVAPEPVVVAPTVAVPTPVVAPTVIAPEPVVAPAPTLVAPVPTMEPIVKVPVVSPAITTPVLTPDIRTPATLPAVQLKEPVIATPEGVAPGHRYGVMGTYKDESGNEAVILRNPWGSGDPDAQEPKDVNSVVQDVLRESYQETSKDLQSHADKVRSFNDSKNAVRENVNDLRSAKKELTSDSGTEKEQLVVLFKVFKESIDEQNQDKQYWLEKLEQMNEIGEAMGDYLRELNENMPGWGEGAEGSDEPDPAGVVQQMGLLELQQKVQEQSRKYQAISNAIKASHDSASSSVRNLK